MRIRNISGVFVILVYLIAGLSAPAVSQGVRDARIPDGNGLAILIRSTLSALNDANQTGNYTVFRDLGSPAFRQTNSAARLGEIFASLRKKNVNLAPITVITPQLSRPAAINQQGQLYLSGYFPTRPLQIKFELLFAIAQNQWRLFGIRVDTPAAPPPAANQKSKKGKKKK